MTFVDNLKALRLGREQQTVQLLDGTKLRGQLTVYDDCIIIDQRIVPFHAIVWVGKEEQKSLPSKPPPPSMR